MAHPDDKTPSIDRLISDPAVLHFLETLVNDIPCVTTGHAHALLRGVEPAGSGAHRGHGDVRATLSKLKINEYLGSETVKWLPRATAVAAPVVRLQRDSDHAGDADAELVRHFPECPTYLCPESQAPLEVILPADEVERLTDLSRTRIPPPEDHRQAKFHFATEKACDLLRSQNIRVKDWLPSVPTREQVVRGMIVRHKQAERGATPAPYELASTTLVGVFNLAQVLFWEPIRRLRAEGRCSFSIVDENTEFWFNGVLSIDGKVPVSVHYLRPILMHGMRPIVSRWAMEDRASVLWWV